MADHERVDLMLAFSKPIEIIAWVLVAIGLFTTDLLELAPNDRTGMFAAVVAGAVFVLIYFHILLPRVYVWWWVKFITPLAIVLILASIYYFTGSRSEIETIYALLVVVIGIRMGRTISMITALSSAAAILIVPILRPVSSSSLLTSKIIVILVYLFAGYLSAALADALQRQYKRMAVLYQVGRALGSTIEMEQLLELIYKQLSRIISTDTYYVGLYREGDEFIEMLITIDEAKRYPRHRTPFGIGLASYTIKHHEPQVFNHLSIERQALRTGMALVGNGKPSESWLGVPVPMTDGYTGVIVVASYKPHAFKVEDVELVRNIAGQAALALDNARHHALVEDQARRDSLTGVFNHGYFLKQLSNAVDRARATHDFVSLIMLDIDFFKNYNDTYGHVIGDQVLCLIVEAIQVHIKQSDVVGRWGGEEFGIVLPETNVEQARQVANRIRETLAEMPLTDATGRTFPKPTVSQGIATYPTMVADADALVDLADRMLYLAKEQGRDQVFVAELVLR
jgi:diguanylate cyclase (GGDEF)-like protein